MNKFKVKDHIVAIKSRGGEYQIGDKGVINFIDISCIPYYVAFDNGNRAWCNERDIKLDTATEPTVQNWTVRIQPLKGNPDVTVAKLMVDGKFERLETVKRYCKDKYSRETAIYEVIKKLTEVEPAPVPVTEPEPPKPEPIMVGNIELKVGSRFILCKEYSIVDSCHLGEIGWQKLRNKVHTVSDIDYTDNVIYFTSNLFDDCNRWRIRTAAIDRIIEVTP